MLLLLPLVLLQANPSVTIAFPPTPMRQALELLSKATGRKLAASTPFFDDVVLARLHDASADSTLKHLAEAFLAKWEAEPDGTLRLVKDQDAIRRVEREEAAANETLLLNSLKYLARRLAEQPAELDEKAIQQYRAKLQAEEAARKAAEAAKDYARMFIDSSANEETPAWRALARIMPLLGNTQLLAMPFDAREVWSERPTPMQHAFPPACQGALAQYRRELALLQPNVEVDRVRVVVKKWEATSALNTEIQALNRDGEIIDKSGARMNDDSEKLKMPFGLGRPEPAKPGEKPISVPEEATEARIALSHDYGATNRPTILDKWRPRLQDPVKYEPTQWHTGANLLAAAQADGVNLIGTVGDVYGGNYWKQEHPTPSQVYAKNALDMNRDADGWMVVRDHERRHRASRSAARALLTTSWRQGGISVDDAAAWVGQSPDRWPFVNWVGDYLNVLFSGSGPYSSLSTTIDDTALRLWDGLGLTARLSLRRGDTLALSGLPPVAKEVINHLVYWYDGLDDATGEPTERLPKGIDDGTVSLTIAEKVVFTGWASKEGPPTTVRPMDAESFGKFLARGNTYWEVPAETYRTYNRFRLGANRTYTLHFLLQPGAVPMTVKLSETLFDPAGSVVDRLPAALQDEVEKARQQALAKPAPAPTKDVIPPL